ncbi:MAG: hypothetical protein Q9170_003688 [Blastenia crenularia]
MEQKYMVLLRKKITRLQNEIGSNESTAADLGLMENGLHAATTSASKTSFPDSAVPSETVGLLSIRYRERKYNKGRGYMEERDVSSTAVASDPGNHATTLLRCFDERNKYNHSVITIEDEHLKALLSYALSHHPFSNHGENMTVISLFEPFVHNWSRLNDFASNDMSKHAIAKFHKELKEADSESKLAILKDTTALSKAMDYLRDLLQEVQRTPGLDSYFSGAREMCENTDSISFGYLWTIFPPGEIVISRPYMDRVQAFIVKKSMDHIQTRKIRDDNLWALECWTYDWNGTEFNRVPVQFTFEDYDGFRSISSLTCYPIRFHKEVMNDDSEFGKRETPEALREALIERGKRFRDLCLTKGGSQQFDYDGLALLSTTRDGKLGGRDEYADLSSYRRGNPTKKILIKSDRVMVDFASYISHGPQHGRYSPIGELAFLSGDASAGTGYQRSKDDGMAHHDRVKPEQAWEESQFLICPPRVLGFHFQSKQWVELDVSKVRDIAQLRDPSAFQRLELPAPQKTLLQNLVSCHAVKDEDRSMRDLVKGKGNGLVVLLHVLLRVIEYYDGILILTTNRIRTIDIAMQSRLNLAIRYNTLTNDQKNVIYRNFINQVSTEQAYNKEELLNYVTNQQDEPPFELLNGRQIRNVLVSAATLARAEPDKLLRLGHVQKVLKETVKFQQDIQPMVDMARQEAEVAFHPRRF